MDRDRARRIQRWARCVCNHTRDSGNAWEGRPISGVPGDRAGGWLQLSSLGTDFTRMSIRSLRSAIALLAALVGASGCISNDGTPVYVDYGALEVWSGKGMLIEVSPDQAQCRVIVRDNHLIRRDRWVPCIHVHPRRRL